MFEQTARLDKTADLRYNLEANLNIGVSPSGKAADFGSAIPRFESWYPSHLGLARGASI